MDEISRAMDTCSGGCLCMICRSVVAIHKVEVVDKLQRRHWGMRGYREESERMNGTKVLTLSTWYYNLVSRTQ